MEPENTHSKGDSDVDWLKVSKLAISKTRNEEWRNGEQGISKIGNL